jgi:hypothetical protein
MEDLGFIILRHVNSEFTDKYWILCYESIRKFYPENKIIIIDDNSNYNYITDKKLYKTKIIKSEYPGRGELLPYFYYLQNKEFETALIIHDSVFINKKVDLSINNYKILWSFKHNWDQITDETRMIDAFNDKELKKFYQNKNLWKGCFGCMSIIKHDYLVFINSKNNISLLLDFIRTRYNRCSLERVIACLLQFHDNDNDNDDNDDNDDDIANKSLFGDIHKYCNYGITFIDKDKYDLPFTKVWSGR